METNEAVLRPATIFAFYKVFFRILLTAAFLILAWYLSPMYIFFAFVAALFAFYRFCYIRAFKYVINPEYVAVTRGLFFKRTDRVEMYRIKDYIVTQSPVLQIFRLMDLTLKGTDPENPVIILRGIPESDIVDRIRNHVQEMRQHNRIYEIN